MKIIPKTQFELSIIGSYLLVTDKTDFNNFPFAISEYNQCVILENIDNGLVSLYTAEGFTKEMQLNAGSHYQFNYLLVKREDDLCSKIIQEPQYTFRWCEGNIYINIGDEYNPNWEKITERNIYWFQYFPDENQHTVFLYMRDCDDLSTYVIKKIDRHKFQLQFLIDVVAIRYSVTDVTGAVIVEENLTTENIIEFEFEKDGIYFVHLQWLDNGGNIIGQDTGIIYDLTDIEDCYQKIIDYILCEQEGDGCDCQSNESKKAKDFAILYSALRDIIYSDNAIRYGILSYPEVDQPTLVKQGKIIKKLSLYAENCTC